MLTMVTDDLNFHDDDFDDDNHHDDHDDDGDDGGGGGGGGGDHGGLMCGHKEEGLDQSMELKLGQPTL